MILQSAAVVAALGLVLFILGYSFDRPELVMLGAIVVIGVGASGMAGGFQVADGTVEYTNAENETVTEKTYSDVETQGDFPLGVVVTLIGTVMFMAGAGRASET
jgi:multisubunit Na+/H+ antiporter MnhB subunit